jgi:hypothetical protein
MFTTQVMAASASDPISGRTLLALAPLVLLLLGLMAYCLMDLARAPSVRYLPKPGSTENPLGSWGLSVP